MHTFEETDTVTLFLAGDVMLGRGIDQISPYASDPELREAYVKSAATYVALAEDIHGPIPAPVDAAYVWGDGLDVLNAIRPDASIVNLETSVTRNNGFWPAKGVHYRMRPENLAYLHAAHVDICALANNHVLDFDVPGLLETLAALERAGLHYTGAGNDLEHARRPARVALPGNTTLAVFGLGSMSSGIPAEWAAGAEQPGVHLLRELSSASADHVADAIVAHRAANERAVVSIHWGGNWGYDVHAAHVEFAHRLIDRGVDLVHGHSSHHVRAIEIYRGRLILYGCGDLIDDYEGIEFPAMYRGDLGAMYFASLAQDGALSALRIVPFHMQRLRLTRAARADVAWLTATFNRIGLAFGSHFEADHDGSILLSTPT
jgi:poly-gamma-glutamate capsule biosynthesis protein CapA/YwtB (metallophosphatase superfamily)